MDEENVILGYATTIGDNFDKYYISLMNRENLLFNVEIRDTLNLQINSIDKVSMNNKGTYYVFSTALDDQLNDAPVYEERVIVP